MKSSTAAGHQAIATIKKSTRGFSLIELLAAMVIMGLLLGWAAVVAVGDFIPKLGIPWGYLVIFLAIGGIIGVLAAYFPARRAAKLNVLDAIASHS